MSIFLRIKNNDKLFEETTTEKFICNDIDIFDPEQKEIIANHVIRNYTDDSISIIPSCGCGELKGAFYVGRTCSNCMTTVKSSIEDSINFLLWARTPEGVSKFINPYVMATLLSRYKINGRDIPIVEYLILPSAKFKANLKPGEKLLVDKLHFELDKLGVKRGYNDFVENFYDIIEVLEDVTRNRGKNRATREHFVKYLIDNRDRIFSTYIPFPNNIIFVLETNELGRYMDKSLIKNLDVIRSLTGIDVHTSTNRVKQNRVAKGLINLANFYMVYLRKGSFVKEGLIRQHIGSTRAHFTGRAVISMIPTRHQYDEIHLPWSLSCNLFREHILNRLYKRGYTYKDAIEHLYSHNRQYSPVLDEVFNELISLSGNGIPILFNRNPSLHRGSIQALRVTRIKNDIEDNTISFSIMITRAFNADFDGDEMNLFLPTTAKMLDKIDNFSPHLNILSIKGENTFTGNIGYPKTIVSTLSNWLE